MRLTDFDVLSFDCYGTLIDWESGLTRALQPVLGRAGRAVPRDEALQIFARLEHAAEAETPGAPYPEILARVHARLAAEIGTDSSVDEDARFGASVGTWPPFPDSPGALQYLQRHYRLAILSNVDRGSIAASIERLQVRFDLVCTAQDIGSYKPDLRNFTYLLGKLRAAGYAKERVLHVAESLFHDHAPANSIGLASAWIHRRAAEQGHGATAVPASMPHYDFRFTSLAGLAQAHRAALAAP